MVKFYQVKVMRVCGGINANDILLKTPAFSEPYQTLWEMWGKMSPFWLRLKKRRKKKKGELQI